MLNIRKKLCIRNQHLGDCSDEGKGGCAAQTPAGSAGSERLLFLCQTRIKRHQKCWSHIRADAVGVGLTRVLLGEGDVGVHQTPGDAAPNKNHENLIPHQSNQSQGRFLPDVQA